jgi:hypothetical protein
MPQQRSRSRVTQGKQWTAVVDCLALLCMGGERRGDNGPAAAGGEPPEALPRETITEALMQVPGCIFQDVTGQLTGFLITQARTGGDVVQEHDTRIWGHPSSYWPKKAFPEVHVEQDGVLLVEGMACLGSLATPSFDPSAIETDMAIQESRKGRGKWASHVRIGKQDR